KAEALRVGHAGEDVRIDLDAEIRAVGRLDVAAMAVQVAGAGSKIQAVGARKRERPNVVHVRTRRETESIVRQAVLLETGRGSGNRSRRALLDGQIGGLGGADQAKRGNGDGCKFHDGKLSMQRRTLLCRRS